MGLLDLFKKNKMQVPSQESRPDKESPAQSKISSSARNSPDSYADSSTISPDERPFYQPDSYYTYYSYPGTALAQKVIPFDDRKKISYPSSRGLYVAEIMLLEYCKQGKYPKPSSGYPGLWWFQYGIRDIGHALESLEKRGFIKWRAKTADLDTLKVDVLKSILSESNLQTTGKKADLINRIINEIPENDISIPDYCPKYELTELGKSELADNGYVPYMHRHPHKTTEDNTFGTPFTVWEINKLFPDGNAKEWRKVVGEIEKERFGVNMANAPVEPKPKLPSKQEDLSSKKEDMRKYLHANQQIIIEGIKTKGDGFEEECKGLDYMTIGKDKEALIMFYIAIGKKFDAPALYREAANLLRKYGMLEEELSVIEAGLRNIPRGNKHRDALAERKKKVQHLMKR